MSIPGSLDVEKAASDYAPLTNHSVQTFSWEKVTVTVKDRHTKQPLELLSNVKGTINAGTSGSTISMAFSAHTTLQESSWPSWDPVDLARQPS